MDIKRTLATGFEYDLWANRRWLDNLGGFKRLDRAQAILEHMLSAQHIWLQRCGVKLEHGRENIALHGLFQANSEIWQVVLDESDVDSLVTYLTSRGEQYTESVGQIMFHVLNHGTYHRGQLRQLAEEDGFENFPETDLILYFREFGKTG